MTTHRHLLCCIILTPSATTMPHLLFAQSPSRTVRIKTADDIVVAEWNRVNGNLQASAAS
jgi:hypothetical protein